MSAAASDTGSKPSTVRGNLLVLVALFILLALTVASAFVPMGAFNTVANVSIAIAKAVLVLAWYMRLKADSALLRIVACVGFAWLLVLIGLSVVDLLTRSPLIVR